MKILIVGDVHGKIPAFIKIIEEFLTKEPDGKIIQLGDLGFKAQWNYFDNWCKESGAGNQITIVAGNHDDYSDWNKRLTHSSFWCGDSNYPFEDSFYVRGADSIDKHLRTEGVDWWPEEELSYSVLGTIIEQFEGSKPKIVFSHDCPQSVMEKLFPYRDKSRTRQALQQMFELHQPEYHFFGHHHKAIDEVINGTRFICLPELATFELII